MVNKWRSDGPANIVMRRKFWARLADGVLGVPIDRRMERTAPVGRHPGWQLIGVEQRVDGQARDVGEDGLPGVD